MLFSISRKYTDASTSSSATTSSASDRSNSSANSTSSNSNSAPARHARCIDGEYQRKKIPEGMRSLKIDKFYIIFAIWYSNCFNLSTWRLIDDHRVTINEEIFSMKSDKASSCDRYVYTFVYNISVLISYSFCVLTLFLVFN